MTAINVTLSIQPSRTRTVYLLGPYSIACWRSHTLYRVKVENDQRSSRCESSSDVILFQPIGELALTSKDSAARLFMLRNAIGPRQRLFCRETPKQPDLATRQSHRILQRSSNRFWKEDLSCKCQTFLVQQTGTATRPELQESNLRLTTNHKLVCTYYFRHLAILNYSHFRVPSKYPKIPNETKILVFHLLRDSSLPVVLVCFFSLYIIHMYTCISKFDISFSISFIHRR